MVNRVRDSLEATNLTQTKANYTMKRDEEERVRARERESEKHTKQHQQTARKKRTHQAAEATKAKSIVLQIWTVRHTFVTSFKR